MTLVDGANTVAALSSVAVIVMLIRNHRIVLRITAAQGKSIDSQSQQNQYLREMDDINARKIEALATALHSFAQIDPWSGQQCGPHCPYCREDQKNA